ncbi:MAG: RNA polymerase sigma factor [Vicinamibacterales bacterium]
MSLAFVKQIEAGDESALHQLVQEQAPLIRRLAVRHLGNPDDADEVVQDVLWTVIRKAESFRGDAALSTWVHRVAFNATMTRLRRSLRRRDADDALTTDAPTRRRHSLGESPTPEEQVYRIQLRRRLLKALRDVPPTYRTAVVLRDVHGLSTEEAGARLAINPATLKSRLHRGRVMLRAALADVAPVPGPAR